MKRGSGTWPFIVLFLFIGTLTREPAFAQAETARNGLADLRRIDLSLAPVALHGTWLFYKDQLLLPGDVPRGGQPLPFPALWNHIHPANGLPAQGFGTYALTILLPHARPKLALQVPDVYSSYA